jgi:ABC-2 type transport system ATP-binding protein
MIDVSNLSKNFGRFQAVHDLSFSLSKGTVLGFVGPNGAGKTTTMRMLTGYIPPTSGGVHIDGLDITTEAMKVRSVVGYLPETPPLYRELTIGSYLDFVAGLRSVSNAKTRIAEVMEEVGLSGWEKRIIGSLSKGYRQRVGLAQAIIHKPKLLILDEPTSGLDPAQMVGVRRFIKHLSEERTVILSTHILSQLEDICDRILVLKEGRCAAQGTPTEIKKHAGGTRLRIGLLGTSEHYINALSGHKDVKQLSLFSEDESRCTIEVFSDSPKIGEKMFTFTKEQDWPVFALYEHEPTLEDAFLAIVGEE